MQSKPEASGRTLLKGTEVLDSIISVAAASPQVATSILGALGGGSGTGNLLQLVPGAINSISNAAQDAVQEALDVQKRLGLIYFLREKERP